MIESDKISHLLFVAKEILSENKEWTREEWNAYKKKHPATKIKPKFKKTDKHKFNEKVKNFRINRDFSKSVSSDLNDRWDRWSQSYDRYKQYRQPHTFDGSSVHTGIGGVYIHDHVPIWKKGNIPSTELVRTKIDPTKKSEISDRHKMILKGLNLWRHLDKF